jgi:hypothetical protein
MMREDRLVLPIPPGVHWKSEMPILIPEAQKALPEQKRPGETPKPQKTPTLMPPTRRRVQFGSAPAAPAPEALVPKAKAEKPKREKVKADPRHVAAVRELRDRALEHMNSAALVANAKYDVARAMDAPGPAAMPQVKALPQAA